jgi:hypothetical protein
VQVSKLRAESVNSGGTRDRPSAGKILGAVGKVVLQGTIGALSGFFTGGTAAVGTAATTIALSTAGTLAGGAASIAENKGLIGGKTATAIRVVSAVAGGLGTGFASGKALAGGLKTAGVVGGTAVKTAIAGTMDYTSTKQRELRRVKSKYARLAAKTRNIGKEGRFKRLKKALKKKLKRKKKSKSKS